MLDPEEQGGAGRDLQGHSCITVTVGRDHSWAGRFEGGKLSRTQGGRALHREACVGIPRDAQVQGSAAQGKGSDGRRHRWLRDGWLDGDLADHSRVAGDFAIVEHILPFQIGRERELSRRIRGDSEEPSGISTSQDAGLAKGGSCFEVP